MNTKYHEWAYSVGHFILTFGALDLQVFGFLQDHLSAEEYAHAKEDPFKQRLKLVGHILEKSPEAHREFGRLAERLEPLRELRNHIAHGHLLALVQEAPEHPVVMIAKAKDQDNFSVHSSGELSVHSISKATHDLGTALEDFFQLTGSFRQTHGKNPFRS